MFSGNTASHDIKELEHYDAINYSFLFRDFINHVLDRMLLQLVHYGDGGWVRVV